MDPTIPEVSSTAAEPMQIAETGSVVSVPNGHEHDPYYKGTWSGLPNYGCPFCDHATLSGPVGIEEHIYEYHPEETLPEYLPEETQGE